MDVDLTGGDQGGGSARTATKPDETEKKRKPGKSGENNPQKKVKARKVTDEEAQSLIGDMHELGQEMMNALLPDMIAGLPSQKEPWTKYRETHGGDFSQGSFLLLLARSKGLASVYEERVREDLMVRDSALTVEFLEVFPTFAVLDYRVKTLELQWPKWWQ